MLIINYINIFINKAPKININNNTPHTYLFEGRCVTFVQIFARKDVSLLCKETEEKEKECFYENLAFSKTVFKTEDCAEGVDAFLNKRVPKFR